MARDIPHQVLIDYSVRPEDHIQHSISLEPSDITGEPRTEVHDAALNTRTEAHSTAFYPRAEAHRDKPRSYACFAIQYCG